MNHLISFEEAEKLVSNFVNHSILGPIALNQALGGTIGKYSFQNQINNPGFQNGKMAWYCWNEDRATLYHPFFLAFEQFNNYTNNPYPEDPEHETLQAPQNIFTYPTGQSVSHLLKNQQDTLANPINRSISKVEVQLHKKDFGIYFPKDGSNNAFNNQPFGFINSEDRGNGEKSDWETFIDQPGLKAIRYYFGFDDNLTVNKIRIIYIGVDVNGMNMISSDVNSALIIDRSEP